MSSLESQIEALEQQITNLEITVAEQDHTIDVLNQAIVDKEVRLTVLEKKLELLTEYVKHQSASSNIASESEETPPPHY